MRYAARLASAAGRSSSTEQGGSFMTRLRTRVAAAGAAVLTAVSLGVLTGSPPAQAKPFNYAHLNKIQQRLVSGLLAAELNGADPARAQAAAPLAARRASTSSACTNRFGDNVQVNQNCLNLTDPDL